MSFLPIRVNTLRGDHKIDFDVHIKINDKMILYIRQGDSFEGPRLQRLKDKKLKKLFIDPAQEPKYRDYVERNLAIAYDDSSGKDIQTRAEIVHGQQQGNADEVFEQPENAASYQQAKEGMAMYVNFLMSNDGAVASVFNITNGDRSVSHHGVNVATLSVALSNKLGGMDPKIQQLMSLGALLHDFGHQESGLEIDRAVATMTPEEKEIYLKHPAHGSQQLQDKKHFDQLVLNIVAQHEECIDGSGFPAGLREKDMDPAVIIVSSANAFDRLITIEGISPADAGKKIMMERVGHHPLAHIQKLTEILRQK